MSGRGRIELAQRFGSSGQFYGIDWWEGGVKRAKEKIKIYGLKNVSVTLFDACVGCFALSIAPIG